MTTRAALSSFTQYIVETVREPLVVLDGDQQVVAASRAFYDAFDGCGQAEGQVLYELDDGRWDLPILHDILDDALSAEGSVEDVEIEHTFRHLGRRTLVVNARRVPTDALTLLAIEDITQCRRAQHLAERERTLAHLYLDVANVMMVALDTEGRVTLINRAGCELLGYPEHEICGQDWFTRFLPARIRPRERRVFQKLLTGDAQTVEYVEGSIVTRGGEERTILWHNEPIRDAHGRVVGTLSSGADVTRCKHFEHELRESERRFRSLFEASPDAIFVESLDGTVLDVNPAACRLHNVACNALIGTNVRELVPPGQRKAAMRDFDKLMRGEVRSLQAYSWTVNQHAVPVEIRANRFVYNGQQAVLPIVRDIREQRALEREVLRISEEERQRIGRDIHDGLASQFSGIALLGRGLVNQGKKQQPCSLDVLEEITRLARTGADHARALARGLNPVQLDGEGLRAALKELVHSAEILSSLACTLDLDATLPALERDVSTQLYRIIQEAVTNAIKHADATRLVLRAHRHADRFVLTIEDNGHGLPDDLGEAEGLGLHIMPYRARTIGATLSIDSTKGMGTTVTCSVPLPSTSPSSSPPPGDPDLVGDTDEA